MYQENIKKLKCVQVLNCYLQRRSFQLTEQTIHRRKVFSQVNKQTLDQLLELLQNFTVF